MNLFTQTRAAKIDYSPRSISTRPTRKFAKLRPNWFFLFATTTLTEQAPWLKRFYLKPAWQNLEFKKDNNVYSLHALVWQLSTHMSQLSSMSMFFQLLGPARDVYQLIVKSVVHQLIIKSVNWLNTRITAVKNCQSTVNMVFQPVRHTRDVKVYELIVKRDIYQ